MLTPLQGSTLTLQNLLTVPKFPGRTCSSSGDLNRSQLRKEKVYLLVSFLASLILPQSNFPVFHVSLQTVVSDPAIVNIRYAADLQCIFLRTVACNTQSLSSGVLPHVWLLQLSACPQDHWPWSRWLQWQRPVPRLAPAAWRRGRCCRGAEECSASGSPESSAGPGHQPG